MERSLSTQQDQLAVSEGRILQDLIALYKALGGGWNPALELPPVATPEPTDPDQDSDPSLS